MNMCISKNAILLMLSFVGIQIVCAVEWVRYGDGTAEVPREFVDISTNNPLSHVTASLRVSVCGGETMLLCRGRNDGAIPIAGPIMYSPENVITWNRAGWDEPFSPRGMSFDRIVSPGESATWAYEIEELFENKNSPGNSRWIGRTLSLSWWFVTSRSPPIWVAVPNKTGQFSVPNLYPLEWIPAIRPMLVFVYNGTNAAEVEFMLWNGTTKDFAIEKPVAGANRLVASAPAIGYVRELTGQRLEVTNAVIAPRSFARWRVALCEITNQISVADTARIRDAGGDLDIVWKVGDCASSPLRLSFSARPLTFEETEEAFLKAHQGLAHIGADTKLSLSLRLAGIGSNPVVLGTVVNQDAQSFIGNGLGPAILCEPSFRGARASVTYAKTAGGALFVIDPKEEVQFELDPSYMEMRRKYSDRGELVNFFFEYYAQTNGNVWIAFPNRDGKIQKIRAFTEYDLALAPEYLHRKTVNYKTPPLPKESKIVLPLVAPILAFAYTGDTTPELAFVLWNRTDAAINAANPLTPKSRIVASAPAINYTRELAMPGVDAKEMAIAPNTHSDWRLLWKTVLGLIPSDDLARIQAAGGDLDLTWKVGDWESPPLPVRLSKRGVSKPENAK